MLVQDNTQEVSEGCRCAHVESKTEKHIFEITLKNDKIILLQYIVAWPAAIREAQLLALAQR